MIHCCLFFISINHHRDNPRSSSQSLVGECSDTQYNRVKQNTIYQNITSFYRRTYLGEKKCNLHFDICFVHSINFHFNLYLQYNTQHELSPILSETANFTTGGGGGRWIDTS